ncbi:MAG: hypothetical protein ACI92Z_001548 [Paracoccaceae bacterium]|jgi:hypothetical protein
MFEHKRHIDVLQQVGVSFDRAVLSGGGARSQHLPQMFADCLGVPITVAEAREIGALGAAFGAGVGVGIFANYEAGIVAMTRPSGAYLPDPVRKNFYDIRYGAWLDLADRILEQPDMTRAETLDGPYDYIIVGAGTAGCVLVNRLSESPKTRVLLLEAGGIDNYHWIKIPVGYLYCIGNPRTDWMMKTAPEPGLNGRSLVYPRGKVLGGCTSVNGMIYMRVQAADYDHWRQFGNTGWGWDDVLRYFL